MAGLAGVEAAKPVVFIELSTVYATKVVAELRDINMGRKMVTMELAEG